MSAHTPGPWITEAQERARRGDHDSGSEVIVVEARYGLVIADCSPEDGHALVEQHYANARLIAAAPAMLAALQRLLRALEAERSDPGIVRRVELSNALCVAGDAIALATAPSDRQEPATDDGQHLPSYLTIEKAPGARYRHARG